MTLAPASILAIAGGWAALIGAISAFFVARRAFSPAAGELDAETKHLAIMFGWIPLALIGAVIAAGMGI